MGGMATVRGSNECAIQGVPGGHLHTPVFEVLKLKHWDMTMDAKVFLSKTVVVFGITEKFGLRV